MNLSRVEIDIMQQVDLDRGLELAFIHKCPAVVVHPDLIGEALLKRAKMAGRYKIITPVDWPKGQIYGMNKLIGLRSDTFSTNGFEVLITDKSSVSEIKNEVSAISNFITKHISKLAEVRFVLGVTTRSADSIAKMCESLRSIPAPAMIRTDHSTKLQHSKATAQAHLDAISSVRAHIATPIKISGNINSLKTLDLFRDMPNLSFAVSVRQAEEILKDYRGQIQQSNGSQPRS